MHVGGRPTRSCITPVGYVADAKVTTIEGLDPEGRHPLQKAWIDLQVPQCGYCQSGQIMQAASLLKDFPTPSDQDIDAGMAGNLCRCMTYTRIRKAIKQAANELGKGPPMTRLERRRDDGIPGDRFADAPRLSRCASAGASVAFGFARTEALAAAADPQDVFEPTIWYSIDRDGYRHREHHPR